MTDVRFSIDGVEYQAAADTNLVDAAKQNGVYIPTLCYVEGQQCLGTCRVCTVEIGGRSMAACTLSVTEGMAVSLNTPALKDARSALVELLFVEGNHYCPSCEKSGDCTLQAQGYEMQIDVSRYPYRFSPYEVDYQATKLLLDRNRCIHCKRCTDLFVDDGGEQVFAFVGKGDKTRVVIDLTREQHLSDGKAREAAELCPVGAILLKGKGFDRAYGERKYDQRPISQVSLDE